MWITGTLVITPTTLCPNDIATITVSGYNSDPEFNQVVFVTNSQEVIVEILDPNGGTFTSSECAAFQICSYNYLITDFQSPMVGDELSSFDCNIGCCDIICESISFEDTENPVFTNPPANETLTCYELLTPLMDLEWTDNCDGIGMIPGVESGSADLCAGGTITRAWDYTDACGGQLIRTWEANAPRGFTFSHSQTITINPAPDPVFISSPADIQVDCGDIPPIPDLFFTNGLTGFCEIAGTTPRVENGTYDACGGTLTRIWIATDFCGNMTDHVQIITGSPAPPPSFTNLPEDINLNCGDPPPPLTDLFYDNSFAGLCASSGSVTGQETGELDACGGELIRTWDFTDPCGNILTHTQIISSLPAPAPVFDLPPQGTFLSCDEDYPMEPLFYDNGAAGICNISGSVMGQDIVIGDDGCSQDIDRVWTYTDDCGNIIEAVELIFVTDFTPPVMNLPPPDQVIPCSEDVPPMTELGWTDNCEGFGTVTGTDVSDGENPETITRTWEYVDGCGNVDMISQIFTVNNFEILQAVAGICDNQGTLSDPTDDTFTATVEATISSPGPSNQYTVTDGTTTWGAFTYGSLATIPGLPADGSSITLTFTDVDDAACSATATVSQLVCSTDCLLAIETFTIGDCNDNGTLSDPSDDIFDVSVNATAENPGADNQFTVTDGTNTWGPFDYGVGAVISYLPANGNIIILTFNDADDPNCSDNISVNQESCSDCNLTVDAGTGQQLSCSILSVQLFGTSNENVFFEWSGPGINISNQNLENPVVDLPGTYILTVSNLTTGCEETDQVFVDIIDDAPIAVATTPDMITCETTSLVLSSNGSTTGSSILYEWSGPDPDLEINNPNPEITTAGSYILVLTDTVTNCVSQPDTVNVGLNTTPPIAIINLIGSLSCISTSTLLDGVGSSIGDSIEYQWLWEEQIIPGATDLTTVINEPGLYTFVVLNIINGCNASDSILVVDDMTYPVASAGEPTLLNCLIDSVQLNGSASTDLTQITYQWSGPAGGILSGGTTTTPWVGLPGIYIISVVDTLNGCANLDTVIVDQDIVAPIADAGSDVTLDCNSLQAGLDGTSSSNGFPYLLQWVENNGSILSGEETLQPLVDATGDYTLIITNIENGCSTTDNVIVSPPNIPTDLIISMINPTCFGDSDGFVSIDSVIGGQPPYSYELNNQGLSSSNTFSFLSAGIYTLSVIDGNGCGFETSLSMQDGDNVFIDLGDDLTIDLGDSVSLQAYINLLPSEIDSLQWLPLDGTLDCYDCEDPLAKPFYTTEYTATVWDLNGCTARDEITIFIRKDRDIYIPNAFSPNGDGINDVFVIYSGRLDVKQINSLHVYSRWGEEVFENSNFQPNDETHGWDGTLRGEPMNPAVFVYWAEIEFVDGFIGFYKGDISIVK